MCKINIINAGCDAYIALEKNHVQYGRMWSSVLHKGIAQIPGKRLNVTVISDSAEDKEIYLSQRPELSDFFNVDGSFADEDESYGNINFIVHSFSKTDEKRNMEFISEYKSDYIFVSVGSDDFNLSLAKTLNAVCYVCVPLERNKTHRGIPENIIPIYITKNISSEPFFAEL